MQQLRWLCYRGGGQARGPGLVHARTRRGASATVLDLLKPLRPAVNALVLGFGASSTFQLGPFFC